MARQLGRRAVPYGAVVSANALQLEIGAPVLDWVEATARIDAALVVRCDAHQRRCRPDPIMTVHEYKVALEWARWVEDTLEPIRAAAGFHFWRAVERCSAYTEQMYTGEAGRERFG